MSSRSADADTDTVPYKNTESLRTGICICKGNSFFSWNSSNKAIADHVRQQSGKTCALHCAPLDHTPSSFHPMYVRTPRQHALLAQSSLSTDHGRSFSKIASARNLGALERLDGCSASSEMPGSSCAPSHTHDTAATPLSDFAWRGVYRVASHHYIDQQAQPSAPPPRSNTCHRPKDSPTQARNARCWSDFGILQSRPRCRREGRRGRR